MKIYFNPNCSKCRIARNYLEESNCKYEIIEFLKSPMSKEEIKDILKKGNLSINQILRKNEPEYFELIKDKNLSEDQIITILIEHPRILQRPIITSKNNAIIARNFDSLEKAANL
jgi:arsenate reductase (glutaredoxin)